MLRRMIGKVLKDMRVYKSKSVIMILAMITGITGFGIVFTSFSILNRELLANYLNIIPASIKIETLGIPEETLKEVVSLPGVAKTDLRLELQGKICLPNEKWLSLELKVLESFEAQEFELIKYVSGSWPPAKGEILLEQDVFTFCDFETGGSALVTTLKAPPVDFKIAGKVHDPSEAPAHMEVMVYGYISKESLELLGEAPHLTTLMVLVDGDTMDKSRIEETGSRIEKLLQSRGVDIKKITIPEPGVHPHFTQMSSFLYVVGLFGVLAFILSIVLMVNMFSSIITAQIKQIGILKAIGATENRINGIYFLFVLLFALAGLLIGIPVSTLAGGLYSDIAAAELNFIIYDYSVPLTVYVLEVFLGLVFPLLAVSFSIIKTTSRPALEALNFSEVKKDKSSLSLFDRLLEKGAGLNRAFLVSLRNTYRKKKRFFLTLLILSLGGTFFMAPYIIKESLLSTIAYAFESRNYGVEMVFNEKYPEKDLQEIFDGNGDIDSYDLIDIYTAGTGETKGSINLIGIESTAQALKFPIIQGSWLTGEEVPQLVINPMARKYFPDVSVGSSVNLTVMGSQLSVVLTGEANEIAAPAALYMPKAFLAQALPVEAGTKGAFIRQKNGSSLDALLVTLEKELPLKGIEIRSASVLADRRKSVDEHVVIIMDFLRLLSLFLIIIGALSIVSTMGMNLLERKREIGILRSLGATPGRILGMVLTESLIIGFISFLVSCFLAPVLGYAGGSGMTEMLLKTEMIFSLSYEGAFTWLAITTVFVTIASLIPARGASRMVIREAVSYE